ncbi:uncharacterized protein LOC142231164 [Haematobia irritans]|uniref:uncharacterized protein LOC142231164 n=1 Tax=Haematobia irritans TaxID=7368 RepID=UPI003F5097B7
MSLDRFIRVADNLVVFEASLNGKDFPMSSVHSLEVHKEELTSIWERLKYAYELCLADIEEEKQANEGEDNAKGDSKDDSGECSERDTVRHKYTSAYVTYCRCNTRLRELIDELSASTTPVPKSDALPSFGFKLPPCEIPIFSGDYSLWPTFRDIFNAVCMKNPRLSSVEKLFHLRQKTKGEAHDIVSKVPLTDDNFHVAWTNLCSRYENRRVLINIQLKKLFSLSPIPNETPAALKTLQRDINSCISLLKLYEVNVETWDAIFVFTKVTEPKCHLCPKEAHTIQETSTNTLSTPNSGQDQTANTSTSASISYSSQSTNSPGSNVLSCFSSQCRGVLLGTALVNIIHNGIAYKARALVDSGSEGTFIAEKLFNLIKLPSKRTNANISGLNNTLSASVQKECNITLRSTISNGAEVSTTALVVPHLSGSLPSKAIDPDSLPTLPDIPLADPHFFKSSKIDILIGADILPLIMLSGIQNHVCGTLLAQETIFGWILMGPIQSDIKSSTVVSYFNEISLDKEISRFWEVEELPRKRLLSPEDEFCEELYLRTTKRDENGRYIVSLPFRENFPNIVNLGESRNNSLAQFYRNEARLLRTPALKSEYDNVLEEYLLLNHMRRVSIPNSSVSNGSLYYLPHHAVIKPESTTTKVRVVFNASSATSNGTSLNDVLYTGPVLQNDLTVVILKWRFYQFVFNGDISKMYRQILVDPDHSRFQKILFRKDPNLPIQDYELKTVTFGINCAPYLAIRTLLRLADDVQSVYPLASDILRKSMYVDDALVGAHSIAETIEARNQLVRALGSAGFQMRKWTSNSKEVIADIPSEDLLCDDFLRFNDRSTAKTLGIRWNAMSDCFYFSTQPFPETNSFSKREVLSQISKLFDPAGWLSPCIIIAKIIMQKIWIEKTEWDEVIPPAILSQWKLFREKYMAINSLRIPRWFQYVPNCNIQFHGFCDASEKAYAGVLYVRIETDRGISTTLVSSKTRVAPIKTLSIPRLELCGATLLAEMIDSIIPQLGIACYSVYCWTDSTIVLSWLSKPPCFWATFVANRVSKIVEITNPCNWGHVSSECNPADLASRGVYPIDLLDTNLWWQGPIWLRAPMNSWPITTDYSSEDLQIERKSIKVNFAFFEKFEDILNRFSSFSRALRVIAYIYRFYYSTHPKYRSNFRTSSTVLSSSEISMAQTKLITTSQKAYFPNEYSSLSLKRPILKSSPLLNLNPFCDSEGVLRICGRLAASPSLTYNERHPVILPYNCQFSRLLVRFIHEISLHGGNQLVLRLIRVQFWIPKVKNLIKSTINKCKPCILYKRRCQSQLMAALPPERADFSRPFSHTGLDFAGPFDIKNYAGRGCIITKGYVCVFVCFATKAIHLEATSDLSTSSFLAAFDRFISRRGCPLHIHSDNGTTFVGASKILAREFIQSSKNAVTSGFAHQNISWHFIPPGAPHMGGLWEAGVKSFKLHFRKVAGNSKYTFEEFQTLLSRIEACLNSRPLSPMSQEPSDFNALTPGHFLIGSPVLAPIEPNIREAPMSLVNRWQRVKAIHQHFCTRWKDEYLKELHKRNKWKRPTDNLKEDMLVVVREENTPPNSWRLGRVSKIYEGTDRRVRVADIKTERGVITRPIVKLVILPTESD